MGCANKYGSIAVGVYGSHQVGPRPMDEDLTQPKFNWQCREAKTWKDPSRFFSRWPNGQFGMVGNDGSSAGVAGGWGFEPFSCDGAGTQTLKFLKGQTVDTSDAGLSGVNVQAFRTSDDAFAGYEVQSRTDGSYDLATNFPGVNHYVVAYLAGSPDRGGTTLNTLVPTNIDGT